MSIKRLHEEKAFIPDKMKLLIGKTYSPIMPKDEKYLSFLDLPIDEEALTNFWICPDEPVAIATREKYISDRISNRISIDNKPFYGAKLVALNAQGMVVDYQGLRVDLTLEVSEDVLLNAKILSDKTIKCNFIWYAEISFISNKEIYYRCDLIRENSPIHLSILKLQDQRKQKPISFDNMKFGKIYETNLGDTFAYLGKYISTPYSVTSKPSELDFNPAQPVERHLLYHLKGNKPKEFKTNKRLDFNLCMWETHPIFYSALFLEEGKDIKIKPSFLEELREISRDQAKKSILNISKSKYKAIRKIESNYSFFNIVRSSDPTIQNFNIRGYLSLL